ncbi:MAG: MBL fold metallo-hydrolase [Pseudomonadota bacterium]
MRFASLGSGSSGNATVIQTSQTAVMLDCGFSCKETVNRLQRLNLDPTSIDAIIVTHEHNDHLSGVGTFSRKFKVPVWMNLGTYRARKIGTLTELNLFNSHQEFVINGLKLKPFVVPHDSQEAVQFIFSDQQKKLAIVTDLGHITPHIISVLKDLNAIIIEANHDYDMLWAGSYRHSLKQRVSGNFGHLNNHQAARLIAQLDTQSLQYLIAAHLSGENNTIAKTKAAFTQVLGSLPSHFEVANQSAGFDWKVIS